MHCAVLHLARFVAVAAWLLSGTAAAADIYVYRAADGSSLITDHPRMEAGYRLIKVYPESDVWEQTGQRQRPATFRPGPTSFDGLIRTTANQLSIDPMLIKSVMHAESAFDPDAVSRKGASGLMQLMPATARRYGVSSIFDPRQNVMGGARYLSFLMDRFDGNLSLVLAGYNAGENAVDRHGGIPPYAETRHYVKKVLRFYRQYRTESCGQAVNGNSEFDGRIISCSASLRESGGNPTIGSVNMDVSPGGEADPGDAVLLSAEDSQGGWRHLE